jgi:hypothetical protein
MSQKRESQILSEGGIQNDAGETLQAQCPTHPQNCPKISSVRPPRRYVRDIEVGETGWIEWSDMVVDLETRCYLHAEAKLKPEETGLKYIGDVVG